MASLSQQLCKICGIEPKCINCGQTVKETIVSKNIDFFIRKKICV